MRQLAQRISDTEQNLHVIDAAGELRLIIHPAIWTGGSLIPFAKSGSHPTRKLFAADQHEAKLARRFFALQHQPQFLVANAQRHRLRALVVQG